MHRLLLLVAISLVATCALPASARAATVSVKRYETTGPKGGSEVSFGIVVEAAPGEANRVVLTTVGSGSVEVRDIVPLTAGAGCVSLAEGAIRCDPSPTASFTDVAVRAGDGADEIDGRGVRQPYEASGGEGADRLLGPDGASLYGEGGDDALAVESASGSASASRVPFSRLGGGAGDDRLQGGPNGDELIPDGPGADIGDDLVDGGGGADVVSYATRTVGVTVDLADPSPDGATGERDTLVSIEGVAGGAGEDRLLGDEGPNRLVGVPTASPGAAGDRVDGRGGDDSVDGGTGDDVLRGGAGDDELSSGGGHDRLDAGAGDDQLSLPSGADRSSPLSASACGAGHDTFLDPPARTTLPRDCERLALGDFDVSVLGVDRRRHRLRLRVRGGDASAFPPCRVRLDAGRRATSRSTQDRRSHALTVAYAPRRGDRAEVDVDFAPDCKPLRYRHERTLLLRLPRGA